jgi:hypothetical protein
MMPNESMVVFLILCLNSCQQVLSGSVDQGLRTAAAEGCGGVIFLRANFSFSSERGLGLALKSLFRRLSGGPEMPVAIWGISKEVEGAMLVYFLDLKSQIMGGAPSYHSLQACTFIWVPKRKETTVP